MKYIIRFTTKMGYAARSDITGNGTLNDAKQAARLAADKCHDCYTYSIEYDKEYHHYSWGHNFLERTKVRQNTR